jgi:hypothetical protein
MHMAPKDDPMLKAYLLRDVPLFVWRQAKARAILEGKSIRAVLIALLTEYGRGKAKTDTQRGQR